MESVENPLTLPESRNPQESIDLNLVTDLTAMNGSTELAPTALQTFHKPYMSDQRRERLEEFASAFLDVSVFDVADVWTTTGDQSDYLGHITSITSSETNETLNDFKRLSENVMIKFWSGAVGRAYSSGNPVWSCNPVSKNSLILCGKSIASLFVLNLLLCTRFDPRMYSSMLVALNCSRG